jgi:hypothetical protein
MQIYVAGAAPILNEQVRAYAEYKVFSQLASLGRDCTISADLGEAGCVRTRIRRPHPVGAIDAAAHALARAAARRLTGSATS